MNNNEYLTERIISLAIEEDVENGDITTNALVPEESVAVAVMIAKNDGVVSGLGVAGKVFEKFDPSVEWTPYVKEGQRVVKGEKIAQVRGSFRALLTAERTALNILQRMSGIATATAEYVKELNGTCTKLLDTRKTAPGMRILDKMAVVAGGGANHRMGLWDMALIKDNHIKVAGSISKAVAQVRAFVKPGTLVEVEVTDLKEVSEALKAGADIIMLDNMRTEMMAEAVKFIGSKAKTEASGNMNLKRVREVALAGVDYISVGALTHSVTALDISMNIVPEEKAAQKNK